MKRSLLPGYSETIRDQAAKERYVEKLKILKGEDPYELSRDCWKDDIDLWPATTHIHIGLYLLLNPSPYSAEDLQNYKSLDCYTNFTSGWVREVLVRVIDAKRLIIAKVLAIS